MRSVTVLTGARGGRQQAGSNAGRRRPLLALAALCLLLAACGEDPVSVRPDEISTSAPAAISPFASTSAYIQTDKDLYTPGEIVHITGGNWSPGSNVNLRLRRTPATHPDSTWSVVADAAGNLAESTYLVEEYDVGVAVQVAQVGTGVNLVFTGNRVISQVEVLDPTNSQLVAVAGDVPPHVTVGSAATVTATITGAPDGVANSWQSTRWEIRDGFNLSLIASGCDDGVNVTSPGSGSHTLTFTAPDISASAVNLIHHSLRFYTYGADGCVGPTGGGPNGASSHRRALRVAKVPAGRRINSVDLLDPGTNAFVNLDSVKPPQVIVSSGQMLTARLDVSTGISGGEGSWQSTRWDIFQGLTGPTLASGCDDGINVTSWTFSAQHELTFPAPLHPGEYTLRFTAFAGDGCTSPSGSGTNGTSRHVSSLLVSGITAVELLDPAAGEFVTLNGTTLPDVSMYGGDQITLRVTANVDSWQSTGVQFGFGQLICDPGIDIAAEMTGAQHTLNVTLPHVSYGVAIGLTVTAYGSNNCGALIGQSNHAVVIDDPTRITAVELQDPLTGTFMVLPFGVTSTLTVLGNAPIIARVTANTGGADPDWEATAVQYFSGGSVRQCDTQIAITSPTIGAQHTLSIGGLIGALNLRFELYDDTFCADPPNTPSQYFARAVATRSVVIDRATFKGEVFDPHTNEYVTLHEDPPPTVTVLPNANISSRITASSTQAGQPWESTRWDVRMASGFVIATGCDDAVDASTVPGIGVKTLSLPAPATTGTYTLRFSLYAQDGCQDLLAIRNFYGSLIVASNTPPVLSDVPVSPQAIQEGTLYTFDANASDAESPPQNLTFSLSGAPAGATINSATGVFAWTPDETQGPGVYNFTVRVSDGSANANQLVTLNVLESNNIPTLSNVPASAVISELSQFNFVASASDSDTPAQTLTFSLSGAPAGAVINSFIGLFKWTPTEAQGPGTYTFYVNVSDGTATQTQEVVLNVVELNVSPVLSNVPAAATVPELAPYSFTASPTDADLPNQTLSLSIVGTLPAGATFNTSTGVFSWTPTEAQGPGVFGFSVRVSDGIASTDKAVTLAVGEVNLPPVLTVPANFSIPWGEPIKGKTASATDPDAPANTLAYSLVTAPAGMSVNGITGALSWIPLSTQVGLHTVTVRVTDNGNPALSDTKSFSVKTARGTTLTYDGDASGQYSDKALLSATLTSSATNAPIAGQTVTFDFNGTTVGSATTDANGRAMLMHQLLVAAGSYVVEAEFADVGDFLSSSSTSTFVASKEDAVIVYGSGNVGAIPVSQNTYSIAVSVKEALTEPSPSPDPASQAAPGFISNAGLSARLVGLSTSNSYAVSSCTLASTSGSEPSYATMRNFTCAFTGPFAVDAYVVEITINGAHYAGSEEDAMTVYDPDAVAVHGGGTFTLGGERVVFGISFTAGKGKTQPRGAIIVIRHHADGSRCRLKSNALDAPAISGTTASYTGKGNYTCVNTLGVTTASAGNQTILGFVQDLATPGANADLFWVRAYGELLMSDVPSAAANAVLLTGGNIRVP